MSRRFPPSLAFAQGSRLGSSFLLPPASWQARVLTHQYFSRHAAARRVARLSTRLLLAFLGGRDFYVRAFPARVTPWRGRI